MEHGRVESRRQLGRPGAGASPLQFWLWFPLPVAIHYQRKPRREAEQSAGAYVWPHTIWNRPLLLWFIVLGASFVFLLVTAMLGLYGP
jgi:hypothetical protein